VQPIDLSLLPSTSRITDGGRLEIGGVDVLDAAAEFGTPLFLYDEQDLTDQFTAAHKLFGDGVAYATKAFLTKAVARLAYAAGMSLDVSTSGEYETCRRAGVPADRLVVHGNNKTGAEIERAVREGVQWIVADNFDDLRRISATAAELRVRANVLVRVNPGVEVHTHRFVATGNRHSKFGFPSWTDDAERAIGIARRDPWMNFLGVHIHVGSFVLSVDTFLAGLDAVVDFVRHTESEVFVIGGGLGVRYLNEDACPTLEEWGGAILDRCREQGIGSRVLAEPGRAMVARAGVTLYSVGGISVKGDHTFVSVDGGMSDNPRPLLYDSGYEAFAAADPLAPRDRVIDIVGRHCESGDTLIRAGYLPSDVAVGDVLCTPVTGAYGYSMASNYNMMTRPAIVFAKDGAARLVVRRETVDDLLATDVG
jgi:diaminopimelate decarboxylase